MSLTSMMNLSYTFLLAAALLVGCSGNRAPDPAGAPRAEALPGTFVAPESCARYQWGDQRGWLVAEQGCGYEQPCRADKTRTSASVVLVGDDGQRTTIINGLRSANGVAVDANGNVWVADDGASEIVVRAQNGSVARLHVPGQTLLNDVTPTPWHPSSVWVSDSKAGAVYLLSLENGRIMLNTYRAGLTDAPNGLAPAFDTDGVVVADLGDFAIPGKAGPIVAVPPSAAAQHGDCSRWYGGSPTSLRSPSRRKLDGIVPFRHRGVDGYLVSAIVNHDAYDHALDAARAQGLDGTASLTAAEDASFAAELWFLPASGGAPEMIFDLNAVVPSGHSMPISGADIGVDPKTGMICVPDLNGSKDEKANGGAAAKVYLIKGL